MFYDRMKNTATRLLTQYGKSASIEDLQGNVLGTVMLVEGTAKNDYIPATVVDRYETIVYCTATSIIPEVEHFVSMNGTVYKVIYVDTFSPANTILLYRMFLSK